MKKKKIRALGGKSTLIFLLLMFSASCVFIFSAIAAKNKVNLKKIVVSDINGTIITATKKGRTYTIEAENAKIFSKNNKKISFDKIYAGDRISVRGRIVGGVIIAKSIKDLSIKKKELTRRNQSPYPLHTNITATVFWIGEPQGGGSSENNALSAWDDLWQAHFGCFDDPFQRNGYHPQGCTPKENPFYFDLPYDDFNGDARRSDAYQVVPWANSQNWQENESMLKNRWIKVIRGNNVCYAQWEDAGPYVYDDARYVFGVKDERPKSAEANNAGMDVSPALRDCLKFDGLNNDTNKVTWQFVESGNVPSGPWKDIVTISGTSWK